MGFQRKRVYFKEIYHLFLPLQPAFLVLLPLKKKKDPSFQFQHQCLEWSARSPTLFSEMYLLGQKLQEKVHFMCLFTEERRQSMPKEVLFEQNFIREIDANKEKFIFQEKNKLS